MGDPLLLDVPKLVFIQMYRFTIEMCIMYTVSAGLNWIKEY